MDPGFIALIVAGITLAGAVVKFAASLKGDLKQIHILVNDRLTEALNRIDQLQETLESADVEIPRRPGRDV